MSVIWLVKIVNIDFCYYFFSTSNEEFPDQKIGDFPTLSELLTVQTHSLALQSQHCIELVTYEKKGLLKEKETGKFETVGQ